MAETRNFREALEPFACGASSWLFFHGLGGKAGVTSRGGDLQKRHERAPIEPHDFDCFVAVVERDGRTTAGCCFVLT